MMKLCPLLDPDVYTGNCFEKKCALWVDGKSPMCAIKLLALEQGRIVEKLKKSVMNWMVRRQ